MTTTNEKDTPDHLLEQHDGLKLSTSKPVKQTPLPLPQITTLFVLLFANAAISTAPYPFLPFMVRSYSCWHPLASRFAAECTAHVAISDASGPKW